MQLGMSFSKDTSLKWPDEHFRIDKLRRALEAAEVAGVPGAPSEFQKVSNTHLIE